MTQSSEGLVEQQRCLIERSQCILGARKIAECLRAILQRVGASLRDDQGRIGSGRQHGRDGDCDIRNGEGFDRLVVQPRLDLAA